MRRIRCSKLQKKLLTDFKKKRQPRLPRELRLSWVSTRAAYNCVSSKNVDEKSSPHELQSICAYSVILDFLCCVNRLITEYSLDNSF